MKIVLSAAFVLCASSFHLRAADTAYQALRVVGAQRGQDALNHVEEVQGRAGVPNPVVWRVILDDPASRGGVRELDIAHGKIVGEHTPTRGFGGSAAGALIDFHKLNLDSAGVFTVAEKEAQKSHLGFDSVDYTLRTGDGTDASPVWVVNLLNGAGRSVATLTIAADNGAIVSSDVGSHRLADDAVDQPVPPPPVHPHGDYTVQETDHDSVTVTTTDPDEPPRRRYDDSDTEDTQGLRVGHRIKEAFITAGGKLENFFTGHHSDDR